ELAGAVATGQAVLARPALLDVGRGTAAEVVGAFAADHVLDVGHHVVAHAAGPVVVGVAVVGRAVDGHPHGGAARRVADRVPRARTAIERVRARAAVEGVDALVAVEHVRRGTAGQAVVAQAAGDVLGDRRADRGDVVAVAERDVDLGQLGDR